MESTNLAKKETTAVAIPEPESASLSDFGVDAADIQLQYLLLMQNTSEMVGENAAKVGDIVNGITKEVLGGADKPLEFSPLFCKKVIRVMDTTTNPPTFKRQEDYPVGQAKPNWEDIDVDGKKIRNDEAVIVSMLLVRDLAKGEAFPVTVMFMRSSLKAGKAVQNHFIRLRSLKLDPLANTLKLTVAKEKNDKGTYAVYQIQPGGKLTVEQTSVAWKWFRTLKAKPELISDIDPSGEKIPF